jgi:hypothetical protein
MMDDVKADISRDEAKRAVKQAILLNEYLLHRAWGILFLALSLSVFISSFGTPIIDLLESIGAASTLPVDMAASGCGIIAVLWAFNRVRNTAEITQPEGDRAWSRLLGPRFLVTLWIGTNAVVILTIVLASSRVPLVLFLIRLGLAALLYYALRLSFSKKIPGEAIIADGSLALSSIASIALLSIDSSPGPYVLLWGATIVVWIFSGVFALTRPIPEPVEERTGLE